MTKRISLYPGEGYMVDNYEVKPFEIIDKEEPIMKVVGEINAACTHIKNAIHMIIENGDEVVVNIERIHNQTSAMMPHDVVFLLVGMALPYFDRACFSEIVEDKHKALLARGGLVESSLLELVKLNIGRSSRTERQLVEWFISTILERITPGECSKWQANLSWRETKVIV